MNFTWRSPSNIALVKYWGKHGNQLPNNSSISFTLSQAYSETKISYSPKQDDGNISLDFIFEGNKNEAFENRIKKFLTAIITHFPFLTAYHLQIESSNSFPHSTGIASSASAMSALSLGLCSIEKEIVGSLQDDESFFKKASIISRLGSGSACRSVYPHLAIWGENAGISGSSNEFAIPFKEAAPIFSTFHDSILIVSSDEKTVSSTAGHELMHTNIFAETRYKQANTNTVKIIEALKNEDMDAFGLIVEEEALTLHALMMTSHPSYVLLQPNSLKLIEVIRNYRNDTKLPVYFTIDAGPNIHLLYPHNIASEIQQLIKSDLSLYCENGKVIEDKVGVGATQIH
jgi:diphosphomevalonate decarboxylase